MESLHDESVAMTVINTIAELKICYSNFTETDLKLFRKIIPWLDLNNQAVINVDFVFNRLQRVSFNKKINKQNADIVKSGLIQKIYDCLNSFDTGKDIVSQAYDSGYVVLPESVNLSAKQLDDYVTQDLTSFLKHSDKKVIEVLSQRFGFNQQVPKTLEEIGHSFTPQLTRERVRQLETRALIELRQRMRVPTEVIWKNLNTHADLQMVTTYPKLAKNFSHINHFLVFLDLLCNFKRNDLEQIVYPDINVKTVIEDWFLYHKAPMPYDEAVYWLVDATGCTERVAHNAIAYSEIKQEIKLDKARSLYPLELNKMYSIVQSALYFPYGANFKDIYERASGAVYSKHEAISDRLDHSIKSAVDNNYLYQSDRGQYTHINYLNISEEQISNILELVYLALSVCEQETMHLRMQIVEEVEELKIFDYFVVRHIVRNYGDKLGIYFSGKSSTDSVSLNEDLKPQGQKQVILNWMEQSKKPLTKLAIAKKIRSKSENHAAYYINQLMEEGKVVRVSADEYTLTNKAYDKEKIKPVVKAAVELLITYQKPVEIGIITEELNVSLHQNYPKTWYLYLLKRFAEELAEPIYSYHNLVSLKPIKQDKTIHEIIRFLENLDDFQNVYQQVLDKVVVGEVEVKNAINNVRRYNKA